MGIQLPTTDDCGIMPASFMELLASTLRTDGNGNVFINTTFTAASYCGCTSYVDCDNNHLTPEQILANAFGLDGCGNLALKLGNCDGSFATLIGRLTAPE